MSWTMYLYGFLLIAFGIGLGVFAVKGIMKPAAEEPVIVDETAETASLEELEEG